jgi:hypothetical protein
MRDPVAVSLRSPCQIALPARAGAIAWSLLRIAGGGDGDRFGIRSIGRTHADLAGRASVDDGDHAGENHLRGAAERARDLDSAFGDGDRRTLLGHVDGEHRALDEGDGVRSADCEMRGRLALDAEQRAAVILDHLDEAGRLGGGREAQPRAGGDDDIFLAPHQHGAAAGTGSDDVARREQSATDRGEDQARMTDSHWPRRFGHPPGWRVGRRGRAAPQGKKQKQKESPHRRRSCPADASDARQGRKGLGDKAFPLLSRLGEAAVKVPAGPAGQARVRSTGWTMPAAARLASAS